MSRRTAYSYRASGRRNTRRACRGKVRYRDQLEAVRAMHTIQSGDKREKQIQRAYECEDCGGWHLTSRAEWRER